MNYIKTTLIILGCFLNNDLFSGPIYASRWQKNGQNICLYGDNHGTHKKFGDDDYKLALKFYENLLSLNGNILLLVEDHQHEPPFDKELLKQLYTWDRTESDKMFLNIINDLIYRQNINEQEQGYIPAKTIDTRGEYLLFEYLLNIYEECGNIHIKLELLQQEGEAILEYQYWYIKFLNLFEQLYNKLGDKLLSDLLNQPIDRMRLLSESCANRDVKVILDEILNRFVGRKKLIWNQLQKMGFSQEELSTLSVKDILCITDKTSVSDESSKKYPKLFHILKGSVALGAYYQDEIVEANALWYIAGMEKIHANVGVIAGNKHIKCIEQYLTVLGYKQVDAAEIEQGEIFTQVSNAKDHVFIDNAKSTNDYISVPEDEVFSARIYCDFNYIKPSTKELNRSLKNYMKNLNLIPVQALDWLK